MSNPLTWLSRRRFPYEPLINVEISRKRLLHNLNEFRRIAPHGRVAPVLKSNAYGHGFREVASILKHSDHIPFFVVDSYFEAVALHSDGVRNEILIMGYTRPETILSSRLSHAVFTVAALDTLQHLKETRRRLPIHLKIDTGMHRHGIMPEEIEHAIDLLAENPLIELKGLCTHLSDADNPDPSFTEGQIKIWNRAVERFRSQCAALDFIHASATDGHRYTNEIESNVSRLGIGLYGLADGRAFSPHLELAPVMKMKTLITGVKKISRDQTIGYGNTYKAPRDMTMATIPAGYFEGIDRRLSNKGSIGVGSEEIACPIVGRVSMNITTIDISRIPHTEIGTPVTVVGDNPWDRNSIMEMAKAAGTIPYEIAVHVPSHLKRAIV
ncbi:MAG: alanine racemase [Candidatus Parcubacteria bacterium]|jgi:alanine racemase|nr:alanine racemase [Candidatus Parcubacteria bacterium]